MSLGLVVEKTMTGKGKDGMGHVLLYEGFTLAGILFVAAGVLFFHCRIPLVISYFARWKRPQSGRASAAAAAHPADSAKKPAKEAGRASPKKQAER